MHGADDAQGNVSTIDLTERRALLLAPAPVRLRQLVGRHRAPKLAVGRRRGWPWSIGVDAAIALLVLATLAMAVDVLM